MLGAIACGGSSKRHEPTAPELVAFVDGKSVFGPATEWMKSDLPDVGETGLFPARTPEQCEVAVLHSGEDSFAARMALLSRAKHSIRIEALIFTGDEAGLRVAEVLKQKKAAGVDVKVIVDGLSNSSLQTQWMYFDLKQHGIEVEGYEAIGLQLINEIPNPLVTPWHRDPARPNSRYHEKLWIVDPDEPDAEAVMGGLNIANEYFRVDPTNVPRYWRDQDVIVRGVVLADLTATFDRNFAHFKDLKRDRGGLTDAAWAATRKIMDKTGAPTIAFERRDELVRTVAAFEARTPDLDYQPAQCRFLWSRPRLHESYIQQAYLKLLATARKEVLIGNAYFVPTPSVRLAIEKAARRCVRVSLLSNGPETNDEPGMNLLSRAYYAELLAVNASPEVTACKQPAGVEIWEWQGKAASDATQTQGLYHAKFAVVDRTLSLVGSYNLDPRSEIHNSETAIVFEQPALAAQLISLYEHDLTTSRRITDAEAAGFEKPDSVQRRMKKDFAALFESQL
ncbi:MAG TPA: phosphatidylserine/phosphatidylglycerophosphate/cardiolipin synthase family protein [Kofleriaceae bacterium]|nr:phosphatidylserine/phosphatidylglycerophosphate/cardiolipin synthase family protein [Kofleriaceae bacterium]